MLTRVAQVRERASTNGATEAGAMPAKVSEKILPMLIAGLAKLVELVNQW
jgi:hypothetical protein